MAIKKERLQELIDEGATIYETYRENFSSFFVNHLETHNLKLCNPEISPGFKDTLLVDVEEGDGDIFRYDIFLEDLYEHKSDAEWDLEFGKGSVIRAEELSFKTYEKFEKTGIVYFRFNDTAYFIEKRRYDGNNMLEIYSKFYEEYTSIKVWNFVKDYKQCYTEACRLIKKLFMGE